LWFAASDLIFKQIKVGQREASVGIFFSEAI